MGCKAGTSAYTRAGDDVRRYQACGGRLHASHSDTLTRTRTSTHVESFLAALWLSLAAQSRGRMLLKRSSAQALTRSRSDLNEGHQQQTFLLAAIDLAHAAHLQGPNLRGARPRYARKSYAKLHRQEGGIPGPFALVKVGSPQPNCQCVARCRRF